MYLWIYSWVETITDKSDKFSKLQPFWLICQHFGNHCCFCQNNCCNLMKIYNVLAVYIIVMKACKDMDNIFCLTDPFCGVTWTVRLLCKRKEVIFIHVCIHFSVCLSACSVTQKIMNELWRHFPIFGGTSWLDFGGDLDQNLDSEIF